MIKKLLFCLICFVGIVNINAQTDSSPWIESVAATDSVLPAFIDSSITDSFKFQPFSKAVNINATIIDTVSNDTILWSIFRPYAEIKNQYFVKRNLRKNIPTVKEVKLKIQNTQQWKFWVVALILIYISFVRISNPNNFRVFILSVFNLGLSRKIWEDQRSFFGLVILQLFAIYLFIAAMVINNYLELKHICFFSNYLKQYVAILAILVAIYVGKLIIHGLLGLLLKMPNLSVGFNSNTISVNNFIALVIFPVVVFSIYVNNSLLSAVLVQTIGAIFGLSIVYRLVRSFLLSKGFFSFPTFYLFLYLCALEIAPWFIIGKFLNDYLN